jgi:hypothetical protein
MDLANSGSFVAPKNMRITTSISNISSGPNPNIVSLLDFIELSAMQYNILFYAGKARSIDFYTLSRFHGAPLAKKAHTQKLSKTY